MTIQFNVYIWGDQKIFELVMSETVPYHHLLAILLNTTYCLVCSFITSLYMDELISKFDAIENYQLKSLG